LPSYDVEGNKTIINENTSNDPSVESNPGWSGLTPGEQAAYFQDPQNAVHAGLRGLAQGLWGLTTYGRVQNFFDPSIQPAQAAITRGETPQQTFRDSELGKQAAVNAAYEAGRVTTNEEGNLVSTDTGAPASGGGQTSSQSGVGNPGESDSDGGGFSDTSNMAANGGLITRNGVVRRAEGSPEEGEISDEDFVRMQNTARKGDAYRELEKYLQSRDAMPSIKVAYLPEDTDGVFSSDNLNIGSGTLKISKNAPKATVPSVLAHEMTHAADRQMKQQAIEQGMYGKNNQFTEAYEKLVGPEGRNRTQLLRKLNPEYASENRLYRADPKEVAAYGVGAFSGPSLQDRAPRHVDATAATEFRILMDLAQRNVDEGPKGLAKIPAFLRKLGRYSDGGPVEPQFTDNRRYL
jgi:hypothetical protein